MITLNLNIDFLSKHKHEIAVKPWKTLDFHATFAGYCHPSIIPLAKAFFAIDAFKMLKIGNV